MGSWTDALAHYTLRRHQPPVFSRDFAYANGHGPAVVVLDRMARVSIASTSAKAFAEYVRPLFV